MNDYIKGREFTIKMIPFFSTSTGQPLAKPRYEINIKGGDGSTLQMPWNMFKSIYKTAKRAKQ